VDQDAPVEHHARFMDSPTIESLLMTKGAKASGWCASRRVPSYAVQSSDCAPMEVHADAKRVVHDMRRTLRSGHRLCEIGMSFVFNTCD